MAEHQQFAMLFLGLGELVEHGLHPTLIQTLAIVDLRIVTEHLEHAIACLPCSGGAGASDTRRHHFVRGQAFGDGLRLLASLVGQFAPGIAAVTERFGLGVAHHQQHIFVILGFLRNLLEARSHGRMLQSLTIWCASTQRTRLLSQNNCKKHRINRR
jgi:hypothetical protein